MAGATEGCVARAAPNSRRRDRRAGALDGRGRTPRRHRRRAGGHGARPVRQLLGRGLGRQSRRERAEPPRVARRVLVLRCTSPALAMDNFGCAASRILCGRGSRTHRSGRSGRTYHTGHNNRHPGNHNNSHGSARTTTGTTFATLLGLEA